MYISLKRIISEQTDKLDTITVDVPLFLRLLEYAREDAKHDVDLHDVTQNAVKLSKTNNMLQMKHYNSIISAVKPENNKKT